MTWGKPLQRRRGFTLVELLVVVGIIALLLGLLIPALRRARASASSVRCISNIRQLVQATLTYAVDNDGALPFPNLSPIENGPPVRAGWLYTPPLGSARDPSLVESGQLWAYLRDRQVYHCSMEPSPLTSGPVQYLTSYLMNAATVAFGWHPDPFPLRKMRTDGICLWEGGEDEPGFLWPGSWSEGAAMPGAGFTSRHFEGGTVGCFDGSAKLISDEQYNVYMSQYPGPIWCDPQRADGR